MKNELTPERRQEMVEAAETAARKAGCTCDPDVNVLEAAPSVYTATVAHDDWCALIRRADTN